MPLLNVVLVPAPDRVVVRLTGEADLSTAPMIADALTQAGRLGTAQVVVDVAAVRFWDCSGLQALISFTTRMAGAGRSCRLVGAPAATRRLIELARLADQLDLDGALHELPAPNIVAALPPVPAPVSRPRRSRRPVSTHGTPVVDEWVVPVSG